VSVPLLTPADTQIFDGDVLRELDLDEEISCLHVDAAAVCRVSMRCCSTAVFFCMAHLERWLASTAIQMLRPGHPKCTTCGHRFPVGASLDEVVRVVDL
jgi:hypothetical protein